VMTVLASMIVSYLTDGRIVSNSHLTIDGLINLQVFRDDILLFIIEGTAVTSFGLSRATITILRTVYVRIGICGIVTFIDKRIVRYAVLPSALPTLRAAPSPLRRRDV